MKIETFKPPKPETNGVTAQLKLLKRGQALRLKTAQEHRNALGVMANLGKKRGVKFTTCVDGDDVLVWIKEKD